MRYLLNKMNQDKFIYFRNLLRWLVTVLRVENSVLAFLIPYIHKVFVILETRGKKEAIKYCKSHRLMFMKLIFNDFDLTTLDFKVPKYLTKFARLRDTSPTNGLRLALSVLYISRFIRIKPEPSFVSIEKAPSYSGTPSNLRGKMFEFLKEIGINVRYFGKVPKHLRFKKYHMSSKSGPNGPGIWSAYQDYLSLPSDLKSHLITLGGPKIKDNFEYMDMISDNGEVAEFFGVSEKRIFRKLAAIPDKEGKTREVAIGDYWTQTILRPLHLYQFRILKNIRADCTHNQSGGLNIKPRKGHSYHSIDLSNATDRFPIDIQYEIIKLIAGLDYANSWKAVMVNYPFQYQDRKIKYMTGNPMGFYSSFSSFALAHHFFVWLSCDRAGKRYSKVPYIILGDDIVIGDDDVAREYKSLLVEWDIPFSPEKTHISPHAFEFAKQIVYKGQNISPLSLSSLFKNRKDYISCLSFLHEELKNKSWDYDGGILVESYLRRIQKFSKKRYKKVEPLITLSISILNYLQGNSISLGDELVRYVSKYYYCPDLQNPMFAQVYSHELIRQIIDKEMVRKREHPLGAFRSKKNLKIYTLLRILNNLPEHRGYYVHTFEALPFTSYYNNDVIRPIIIANSAVTIKQQQQDAVAGAFSVDALRKVYNVETRPVNISDFYARHREVDYKTSWNLAKEFAEAAPNMKELDMFGRMYPLKLEPI